MIDETLKKETEEKTTPVETDRGIPQAVMDRVLDAQNTGDDEQKCIALENAFNVLSEREREILFLRFDEGKTQRAVADLMGVSQSQVSRLEKKAISALRKSVEEETPVEPVVEETPVVAVAEEAPAETVEEEPPVETVEEETPVETVEEETPVETVEEETPVETVEEETPVIPVQPPVWQESHQERDWDRIQEENARRNRRRRRTRGITVTLVLLLLVAAAAAAIFFLDPFGWTEQPEYLKLPGTVKLRELTVSTQEELKPTDFVEGLENTGITVSFGQDYSKEKLGQQEFTLIFTQDGKTCSRTADLYRFQIVSQVNVKLGEAYMADIREFVPDSNIDAQFVTTPPNPKQQAGIFDLWITCNEVAYPVQFVITEDIAPTGNGTQITVTAGEDPHPTQFVTNIMDHTEVTVTFKEDPRFDMAGERSVIVVLTDLFGNTTEVRSELVVEPHADGPQFEELSTIYLQVGTAVSYKTGVTVTDPQDGDLTYTVDSRGVDTNTVGKYTAYYTAVDSDGHVLTVQRHIVVETKTGQMLRLEAQMVLDRILTPDMTLEEKIHAIYVYVRWNVHYLGTYNVRNIEEAAYDGFTIGQGDCFVYYSMIRVMLDMIGVPNVECSRVGGTSNHWWNLVQFEDGLYYHVDATPHGVTWMDEHFKMTETTIQEYSADPEVTAHRPNYYVYDHTLQQYQNIQIAQ